MQRWQFAVAVALLCALATPAVARPHAAAQTSLAYSGVICGDRYCPPPAAAPHASPRRHAARVRQSRLAPMLAGYAARPADRPGAARAAALGLITEPTAAGIAITCSREFMPKIQAFIAANVAEGRRFRSITCFSMAPRRTGSRSLHRDGNAADFHPNPDGALAYQFGLRNGCDFGRVDCMHIDNGLARGLSPGARFERRQARQFKAVREVRR